MKCKYEDVINDFKKVHGDKYDYSKVEYKNTHTKVCIICPEHGEFWLSPHDHKKGIGCKKCSINRNKKKLALTTEEFILRAKKIWGDKYNYSKVDYVNANTKVCIICPEHGEFWQTPVNHLKGIDFFNKKNAWSVSRKKKTTEEFILQAKKIHGDKYDYSKVEYVNPQTKVCIICPEHGEFWQTPFNHLDGKGCRQCAFKKISKKQSYTTEEFIKKARKVHGDKYDYSKVEYINSQTKVCIICPEHGEFWQTPDSHLDGKGCRQCAFKIIAKKESYSTEEFIKKAQLLHNNKYDYSKVNYINANTKVCIICPEHGEFWQTPSNHLKGKGCRFCYYEKNKKKLTLTTEEFILRAKKIWGDKYNYSKVKYVDAKTKVRIICPEHGEFWQRPTNHLSYYNCPECSKNDVTKEKLLKHKIVERYKNEEIIYQAHPKYLGRQSYDLFFPKYNIAIEYQGEQHFRPFDFFGGETGFSYTRKMDIKKYKISHEHNITIFYFSFINTDIGDFPYEVIFDIDILFNKIDKKISLYGRR